MLNVKRLIIENNKEYVTISRETCPLPPTDRSEVMSVLSEAVVTYLVRGIACKAILSEAVVTEGEALGNTKNSNCLKDSTLSYDNHYQSTVL